MIGSSSSQKSSCRLPFVWLYFEAAKFWCLMNPIQWTESVGDAWKGNRVCDQTSRHVSQKSFSFLLLFLLFVYLFHLLPIGFPSTWIKSAACSSFSCYYYDYDCTVRSCWIVKRPDALSRFSSSQPFPFPRPLHAKTLSLLGRPLPPLLCLQ